MDIHISNGVMAANQSPLSVCETEKCSALCEIDDQLSSKTTKISRQRYQYKKQFIRIGLRNFYINPKPLMLFPTPSSLIMMIHILDRSP